MHPHLIDWFRNPHINSDAKVIEQRWNVAEQYAEDLNRETAVSLLRLFLSDKPNAAFVKSFTDSLLNLDKEFPVGNNIGELRLMAGIVMVTTFKESSEFADAFALGLQAADFPKGRWHPAQPAILFEANKYLSEEAEWRRPSDFHVESNDLEESILTKQKAVGEAEAAGDAGKITNARSAYNKTLAKGIKEGNKRLSDQIRRLAEESALLWWVISDSCFTLKRRTTSLTSVEFSLVAGAEAAQRTIILPPPVSIGFLLNRALAPCKAATKKKLSLQDFLEASDACFRAELLAKLNFADCGELLPITTALSKSQEFGEAASVSKVMPNLCPGFNVDHPLLPEDAALQFYNELIFLKALAELTP